MEVGKLTVKRRQKTGKSIARKLRVQGRLPGVCYGAGIDTPISVDFDARAFLGSLDPAKRRNTLIDLSIDGGDGQPAERLSVMIKDYQIHPIRREITHVDFLSVDSGQTLTIEVPLDFTGKAKGLVAGGVLHVVRRRIEVQCKPSDIPTQIAVDVTELDANGVIHVSDITLPAGTTAVTPGQLTVITCAAPEADEAEEAGEEEPAAAVAEA